jgi:hypothetical protein
MGAAGEVILNRAFALELPCPFPDNSPPVDGRRCRSIGWSPWEAYRQATASSEGGRNSLLESAQEATITSLAIPAIVGQTNGLPVVSPVAMGKKEVDRLK